MSSDRVSERRKKLILVLISTLLTLLFAEVALRLVGYGEMGRGSRWFAGGNHPRFLFQPDVASGYTLRPGFHGREIASGREFDVPAAIDTAGLRDHPHTAPPRPTILAIGDSMTFGEGVTVDRAWPAVLERASGVRTLNGGVPGYGSPQMEARLRSLLPRLRPDLVLVMLSPHWDQQRCATPFVYKGGYIVAQGYLAKLHLIDGDLFLAETKLPGIGTATAYAKRYSRVARLILPLLGDGARSIWRGVSRPERRDEPATPADLEPTARALAAMQADAARAGAGFFTVFIDSRGPEYRSDQALLEKLLRERNVPFLELDSFLPKADWPRLRYTRDQHWKAPGHQLVGTALAPVARSLLSRRP
jgi:lysophospholipase L1-like esterase